MEEFSIASIAFVGLVLAYIGLLVRTTQKMAAVALQGQNWPKHGQEPNVSVLLAFRNEARALPDLLQALAGQTYPRNGFEVLLVDDHSEDHSRRIIEAFAEENGDLNLRLLALPPGQTGKKAALQWAWDHAQHELWLFTDADTRPHPDWIREMVGWQVQTSAEMVCGPVQIAPGESVVARWEATEFASLVATGAGSLAWGKPSLCNGANFLIRRSALSEARDKRKDAAWPGGDDVFLLHALHKQGKKVVFAPTPGAVVAVPPVADWETFVRQRIRWAAKWRSGLAGSNAGLAIGVWGFHLLFLVGMGGLAWKGQQTTILWLLIGKSLAEWYFLDPFLWQPGFRLHMGRIWLMQIPYSLYVVVSGLWLSVRKPGYEWKGRKFQS